MLKTYLYIPEHLEEKIKHTAKSQKKSKAEVMRNALEKGLGEANEDRNDAQVLLDLAKFAEEHQIKGPKDASLNHDYYLWGFPKKTTRIKP